MALRFDTYLRNYPLGLDEAALARNIIERPWSRLFGWLDYAQIAPPGFLLVEKGVIGAFGSSEYALRFFPLLCGVLSVWLFWEVGRRLLPPLPALMAFGLFALNTTFVDFASHVKPYSGDVAATLVLLLLACRFFEPTMTPRKATAIALAGGTTCFFSLPSVFVLVGAALACMNRAWREHESARRLALVAAAMLWCMWAGVGALLARLTVLPTDLSYMEWFWQPAFMPFPPKTLQDLQWLGHQLRATFRWTSLYRGSVLWIAMAALGLWSFYRRRQSDIAILLAMPIVLVVAASARQLYPFWSGRTQLFLFPMLWMFAAEGTDWWRRTFSNRRLWIGAAPMVILLALAVHSTWSGWRIHREGDLRSVLQHVKSRWYPGDKIFVYNTAGHVFLYYAPRLGFQPSDYIVGSCSDDIQRTSVYQVETFRGRPRVWLAIWATDENELLFRYLTAIGTVRETFSVEHDADVSFVMGGAAVLFDLASPDVSALSPATFSVSDQGQPASAWDCYGVFSAVPSVGQSALR